MAEKTNYRCVPSLQQFYSGGAVTVSSDGTFLACACNEKIKVVSSSDAFVKATLEGDSEMVTALALSPDDKFLFSASHSRLIRVWELSSLKCIRSWKGHDGPIMGMACHLSGGYLATAGSDKKVCVWDVDGGFCTHFFKGHQGVVTSVMFHPDPNHLVLFSGGEDATVRVWNLNTKKCSSVLEKHFSAVTSIAISMTGQTLFSAGRDQVVNIWNLQNYSFVMTVPAYEMVETVSVVSADSGLVCLVPEDPSTRMKSGGDSFPTYFLTAGERGIVRIWSSEGGKCLYEQQASDTTICSDEDRSRRGFMKAIILPSKQELLCVTADQQFLFYCTTPTNEGTSQLSLQRRLVGYNEEIVDLKFLNEEEKFLAVATNLEQVRVYDLSSMSCSYVLVGHTDTVLSLDTCISNYGRTLILSGSKDHSVRLWESESQKCIAVGSGHTEAVVAVAFSKKTRNFFVSGSSDRTIKLWGFEAISGCEQEEVKLKTKAVVSAHDKDINCLAVAPNDSLVCSGSQDRTACIWRLPNLILQVALKGHKRGVWSVEFSPVDQCVLTSSGDQTIKIWAITDGSCLKTFEGHTSSVLQASFLSRGTQLVSCGADGLVKLWTVKTNECISTYDKHEDKIWALAVGRKTEMLATGGGDAVINLWHDCTASDKEAAFRKEEDEVLRGQELENAVTDEDYIKAIKLALELRRAHKIYELFALLCRKRIADNTTKKALGALGKEEVRLLLEYIREWNTKPRLCHIAQFVLSQIFRICPPSEIIEIKGINELLEGLLPYTQRHFGRIDRLVRNTFLLDYTLASMSVLEPDVSLETPQEPLTMEKEKIEKDEIPVVNGTSREENADVLASEVKLPSKKRKSTKSGKGLEKKRAKEAAKLAQGLLLLSPPHFKLI